MINPRDKTARVKLGVKLRGDSMLFRAGSQCRLVQVTLGGAGLSGDRGAESS